MWKVKSRKVLTPEFTNWDEAVVVPIVFGALRTISDELEKNLKRLEISLVVPCLKKVALLELISTITKTAATKNKNNSINKNKNWC